MSALSAWWLQWGIVHPRRPAHPQANGQHERLPRELKRETARPAAATARAQQRRFDTVRAHYTTERPHEGIQDQVPATLGPASPRPYPARRTRPVYPSHLEVRRVSDTGTIRWSSRRPFLTHGLQGAHVGLEEVADGIWNIVYYPTLIGRTDERTLVITGV